MDISRLPAAPFAVPAGNAHRSAATPRSVDAVGAVRHSHAASPRGENVERVIQGELLQRERASYQSTRGFLNERSFDQAQSGDPYATRQTRAAISRYLINTRPESPAELSRGRSVNFFI